MATNTSGEAARLQHIGVIGGGAWGTALAQSACRAGRKVTLWAYEFETVAEINDHRTNRVYLPGVALDPRIRATAKAKDVAAADALLFVAPSQFSRVVASEIAPHLRSGTPVVICTKGVENGTNAFMSEVVREVVPGAEIAVLSGPSFAGEVARNLPTALTLACPDETLGAELTTALAHRTFRLYWTDDVTAAQVGGAVKNVLAIAAGIVEGRKFGANAHAAMVTRGFAELVRLGRALGGRFETLTGLSGLGDLILTASSVQSRNMSLGLALGQGRMLSEILGQRKSVSEGVHSAGAVVALAAKHGVEMPICEAVHSIVKGETSVDDAIDALLSRPLRAEVDFPPAS
ncbi:NAD(P)H-dependent glycerol-3-phosphate dehydrogenase [Rhodomicrobium lacus]|uniref:NAD(P)H-dependent glycerol-3-phosphate dehydrogenase n=1 Tax=Rhodomicrobium lacus TaxID=2498452 RepID=UPI0026E156BD|nr:NAD(P)H-dependent glycerol-3-phosphate dehydrogenase [Rhodomicrobium lacus]WKW50624.1 NAD(P)H-dependent glycerol-3-phosphate dehydrogenase [Rhodomicrobium lacus]